MTPSEKYVSELCEKSFLPFWSYPSPLGKNDKELCDVLLMCGNDIVIISIKDIKVSEHSDQSVQYNRWYSKAIDASINQIYGAERFLENVNEITLNDRVTKVKLPKKENRVIYRIAIAFGSRKDFPLDTGDFGNGYVHVFDEDSTFTVINELDTFPDFVNYLKAKEQFTKDKIVTVPKEVDFLALYIRTSLEFDYIPDTIIIDDNLWSEYIKSDEYNKWQRDIQISFIWDEIVSQLYNIHIKNKLNSNKREELEIATRLINTECRNNRIVLGEALENAMIENVRSRIIKLDIETDHTYVYLKNDSKNWDYKEKELELRCLIARERFPSVPKVIGIGIGITPQGEHIFDYTYLNIPELDNEAIHKIRIAKKELGFFENPRISHSKDIR